MSEHKFPYRWNLADGYPAKGIKPNGCKVFGTFICGGGSTMGYKLAGFTHLGGVEIDPQVAEVYQANHKPKYLYNEDIRLFNERTDLPAELFDLDLLDGSPPCSTFSMAGSREKAWGKEKQFREGQAVQTLDDLVFVYIETIAKLRPKVCLLENVKGIIQGNAKWYSKEIVRRLNAIGYEVQVFCLNAASMGVPQTRERVFFIGRQKGFDWPKLNLEFGEPGIYFSQIDDTCDISTEKMKAGRVELWGKCNSGERFSRYHPKGHYFADYKLGYSDVPPTITASVGDGVWHPIYCRLLNKKEVCMVGTYPLDYDFKTVKPKYLIGMSVPPVMTAQIANQIWEQWLCKIGKVIK